jgi:LPS export ABC transporter protein LptC
MNWRWIWIAAALGAVVAGFGLLANRNPVTSALTETPVQPSYYLKDAVITETDTSGSPAIRLIANSIEQKPGDDSILLHSVRVDYLKVPDKQWYLSAEQGFVPPDSRIIHFEGNVELHPIDAPSNAVLRTNEITLDSERNVAYTTRSPVTIRYGSYSMQARSLEADLNTEKIRMEVVHGRADKS